MEHRGRPPDHRYLRYLHLGTVADLTRRRPCLRRLQRWIPRATSTEWSTRIVKRKTRIVGATGTGVDGSEAGVATVDLPGEPGV